MLSGQKYEAQLHEIAVAPVLRIMVANADRAPGRRPSSSPTYVTYSPRTWDRANSQLCDMLSRRPVLMYRTRGSRTAFTTDRVSSWLKLSLTIISQSS